LVKNSATALEKSALVFGYIRDPYLFGGTGSLNLDFTQLCPIPYGFVVALTVMGTPTIVDLAQDIIDL